MTLTREGTPVGPRRCLDVLRGITSSAPRERHSWARVPGEWFGDGELDYHEDITLAWVLSWAAVQEAQRWPTRCGFFDSLHGLAIDERVPARALNLVGTAISRTDLDPTEVEYYDDLLLAATKPTPVVPPGDRPNLPDLPPGEPIEPAQCIELVRGLTGTNPEPRRTTGRRLAAWTSAGRLDEDQARTLAAVLIWAVQIETTDALHTLIEALAALTQRDLVPPWALNQVLFHLDKTQLDEVGQQVRGRLAAAGEGHRQRALRTD